MTVKLRVPRQASPQRTLADHDYLMMRALSHNIKAALSHAHGRILDVGCGRQPYRSWLGPHDLYLGIDIDRRGSEPDIVSTSVRVPFRDRSLDTVLCLEVLEHVPDSFVMLGEIARVLRPDGYLILTTPQSWRLHEAPYDFFRFTRFGLQYVAEQSGLDVERIEPHGGVWANVGQTVLNAWPHHQLGALLKPGIWAVNMLCSLMEVVWYDDRDPLGHVLVARKPAEQ